MLVPHTQHHPHDRRDALGPGAQSSLWNLRQRDPEALGERSSVTFYSQLEWGEEQRCRYMLRATVLVLVWPPLHV